MNSEELERSLRTDFETYLKDVLSGIKQDVAEFQKNFEAEFAKHKSQLDEAVRVLSARFDSEPSFSKGFTESVVEHLRLARDDGAQVTAKALGEAEKLKDGQGPQPVSYDRIRDAIADITSRTSQSAILKSLVEHAADFAPRGAFFVVKSNHLVGWKVFGEEAGSDDKAVQDLHFAVSSDTLLSSAVSSLSAKASTGGQHADDHLFLEPLGFGRPGQMYAMPLIVRGRGVAVMYVDGGTTGGDFNADALETLVRVAALTVELLAASHEAKSKVDSSTTAAEQVSHKAEPQPVSAYVPSYQPEPAPHTSFETQATESDLDSRTSVISEPEVTYFEPEEVAPPEVVPAASFDPEPSYEAPVEVMPAGAVSAPAAVEEYSNGNGATHAPVIDAPVTPVTPEIGTRAGLSSRHVDLPIEVSETERPLHNQARRFARLLVSEIKLYNEQKVAEGREAKDLYDRLREAIDRSREMYEKRVQPEVAAKFDYFHYELINGLAEGSDDRMGQSYRHANVH